MNHKRIVAFAAVASLLVSLLAGVGWGLTTGGGNPLGQILKVFVTNTSDNPVPANVSGWLHTTKEDASDLSWVYPGGFLTFFSNETRGYREITMRFFIWEGADAEFLVLFGIEGPKGSASFVVDQFTLLRSAYQGVVKTYSVQGSVIEVRARSLNATVNSRVILWFYMTT